MGMKSRGVYETPGGTILQTAHRCARFIREGALQAACVYQALVMPSAFFPLYASHGPC